MLTKILEEAQYNEITVTNVVSQKPTLELHYRSPLANHIGNLCLKKTKTNAVLLTSSVDRIFHRNRKRILV